MKYRLTPAPVLCLLLAGCALAPAAQSQNQPSRNQEVSPAKYVFIDSFSVRSEQTGAFYKAEEGYVQDLRAGNAKFAIVGASPVTGGGEVLTFHPFDSFAEFRESQAALYANPGTASALRATRATVAPLVDHSLRSIYMYRKSLNLRPGFSIRDRFFDITVYRVRAGHTRDFARLARMYAKAAEGIPAYPWMTLEKMYGRGSGDAFVVIAPLSSLGDVDQLLLSGRNRRAVLGADQLQMIEKLTASTVKSSEDELYAASPRISYVSEWAAADPSFWGRK